jgi:hypothetical protein
MRGSILRVRSGAIYREVLSRDAGDEQFVLEPAVPERESIASFHCCLQYGCVNLSRDAGGGRFVLEQVVPEMKRCGMQNGLSVRQEKRIFLRDHELEP